MGKTDTWELFIDILSLAACVHCASFPAGSYAAQVNFHTTVSGQAMVTMIYHKKLDEKWTAAAQKLRKVLGTCPSSSQPSVHIIGRSRKQKVELDAGHVIETLNVDGREFTYKQVRENRTTTSLGRFGLCQGCIREPNVAESTALACTPKL